MEEAEKETTTASKMVQQVEKLSEKLAEEVTAEKPIEVSIFYRQLGYSVWDFGQNFSNILIKCLASDENSWFSLKLNYNFIS